PVDQDDAPRARPRRGRKPQLNHGADEPGTRIVLVPGRADGVGPREIVEAITAASGLDGEAVRDVRVLERFALATIPADGADDAVAAVNGRGDGRVAVRAELLAAE
ncbi:DbpA RNA binding domain-containing protein, partial [Patulibacter sp. S7RM1-6]